MQVLCTFSMLVRTGFTTALVGFVLGLAVG